MSGVRVYDTKDKVSSSSIDELSGLKPIEWVEWVWDGYYSELTIFSEKVSDVVPDLSVSFTWYWPMSFSRMAGIVSLCCRALGLVS